MSPLLASCLQPSCSYSPVFHSRLGRHVPYSNAVSRNGVSRGFLSSRKSHTRCECSPSEVTVVSEDPADRDQCLAELEKVLITMDAHPRGDSQRDSSETTALNLVSSMKQAGMLRAFGEGRKIPKRLYTLDELKLNKIETQELLSPDDTTLNGVTTKLQAVFIAGLIALIIKGGLNTQQIGGLGLAVFFLFTADQVSSGGGALSLVIDTLGRILEPKYKERVALHESGHFMIAFLMGLLPTSYSLSSLDAYQRSGELNIQAGCTFADSTFEKEVSSGQLKASSLEQFTCVALAGVCTEYLRFGKAEGGMSDVMQLDRLLQALNFSQKKADGEIRWAVLNTIEMLRRHSSAQDKLATQMQAGASVAECIRTLEDSLADSTDL